jgi:hypothetical protein
LEDYEGINCLIDDHLQFYSLEEDPVLEPIPGIPAYVWTEEEDEEEEDTDDTDDTDEDTDDTDEDSDEEVIDDTPEDTVTLECIAQEDENGYETGVYTCTECTTDGETGVETCNEYETDSYITY